MSNDLQKRSLRQRLRGTGSAGTGMKLVRISLVFTLDLVDPVRIGSAIWYQNGFTYEGDPIRNRTVPVLNRFRVNTVDPYHS